MRKVVKKRKIDYEIRQEEQLGSERRALSENNNNKKRIE